MTSLRDILLVSRFEVLRAIRTWRALALIMLYLVASAGGAWIFVQLLGEMENSIATAMGVPTTDTPGTMLAELMASDSYHRLVSAFTGSEAMADQLVSVPPLAMWHMWLGLLLVPFFAASASAESISIDLSSRALRYEALRTGRLELVLGRAMGQVILTGMATIVSIIAVWFVGMWFMVGNSPVGLAWALMSLSLRAWIFGLPFVGIGICCSQLTASSAWARVLAIGGTAGTWIGFGFMRWVETTWAAPVADAMLQVLPQGWMRGLWGSPDWMLSSLVCLALAGAAGSLGYLRFAGRDL